MSEQPLNSALQESPLVLAPRPLESIELFAGAGWLALGFSCYDMRHRAVVEWNTHDCNTIRGVRVRERAGPHARSLRRLLRLSC